MEYRYWNCLVSFAGLGGAVEPLDPVVVFGAAEAGSIRCIDSRDSE